MTPLDTNIQHKFLSTLFFELGFRKIKYAVMRNAETLPYRVSRTDIDILINKNDFGVVKQTLSQSAERSGYIFWKQYAKLFDIYQFSFYPRELTNPIDIVLIELHTTYSWMGIEYVDTDSLLDKTVEYNQIKILKPGYSNGLVLLNSLLYSGTPVREKYILEYRRLCDEDKQIAFSILNDKLSVWEIGKRFIKGITDDTGFVLNHTQVRISYLLSSGPRIVLSLFGIVKRYILVIRRVLFSPGLFLVLLGPDGSGKTTVSQELDKNYSKRFRGVFEFHFYPKIFRSLTEKSEQRYRARLNSRTEWENRSRKFSLTASLLRLFYLWIQFWIGYVFFIRPKIAKGGLVIGERWCYDIIIDPHSKGIELPLLIRKFFVHICPPSDLVIILVGDPWKIHQRKRELPVEEVQRQIDVTQELFYSRQKAKCVNANQPITDVLRDVYTLIQTCKRYRW